MFACSSCLSQFFDFCFPGVFCTPRIFFLLVPHHLCISQLFLSSLVSAIVKILKFSGSFSCWWICSGNRSSVSQSLDPISNYLDFSSNLPLLVAPCISLLFLSFFEDFTHLLHLFRVVRDPLAFIGCVSFVAAVQTSSLEYSFF